MLDMIKNKLENMTNKERTLAVIVIGFLITAILPFLVLWYLPTPLFGSREQLHPGTISSWIGILIAAWFYIANVAKLYSDYDFTEASIELADKLKITTAKAYERVVLRWLALWVGIPIAVAFYYNNSNYLLFGYLIYPCWFGLCLLWEEACKVAKNITDDIDDNIDN